MKYLIYMLFAVILFCYCNIYAAVDIKLTRISNTYDSPSSGVATLIIDVEAISTTSDTEINGIQDAIQADANFRVQITSVTFSDKLSNLSTYNTTEDFQSSDGRIRFIYSYNSGSKSTIPLAAWTRVVRITIQYNMTAQTASISWYSLEPNFLVTNGSNVDITGSEQAITSQLTDIPLPVELSSFTASTNQNAVNLNWQTKTEVDNYGFEVERKAANSGVEAGSWEKIGFVNGHGNSNSPKDYSLTDKNPSGGSKFIYRLKQIDNTGEFKYSDEVEVEIVPNEFNLYQNYPNPFNPATNIKFALPKAARVNITIYNVLGENIATLLNEDKEAGFYNIQFDASSYSSGVYVYRLTTEDFVQTKKMNFIK
jgi:hypothetical protein